MIRDHKVQLGCGVMIYDQTTAQLDFDYFSLQLKEHTRAVNSQKLEKWFMCIQNPDEFGQTQRKWLTCTVLQYLLWVHVNWEHTAHCALCTVHTQYLVLGSMTIHIDIHEYWYDIQYDSQTQLYRSTGTVHFVSSINDARSADAESLNYFCE